eukprot:1725092-Amphidinium_carterae.1
MFSSLASRIIRSTLPLKLITHVCIWDKDVWECKTRRRNGTITKLCMQETPLRVQQRKLALSI